MKQLLIISKKKVFRTYAGGILIPYDGADGDSLKKWISARYNMSMVKTQKVAKSDIVVLTVVEKQHCVQGEYISIAKAIELIDNENEPLRNYLNNLRVEFDIQLEYGVQNGKIINIMDLPVESKGLQCDCVCPGCGGRLVARKGAKKKHHFGFLEKVDYRAGIVTRTHSLIPPNETEAKLLENAIKRCDCYSPLIDDEIEATLHPSEVSSGSYNYTWGGEFDAQDHSSRDPILRGIENRQGAEREIGYGDAQRHDFESEEPFYDCFGKRWVVCKCCGQIKREDEMKSYGGRGSENKGICNECSGW